MKRKELLKLLDNLEEQDTVSSNRYDRVLLIDGLNLFFRNFAMMNIVNSQGSTRRRFRWFYSIVRVFN
jgi:hypothetical protein